MAAQKAWGERRAKRYTGGISSGVQSRQLLRQQAAGQVERCSGRAARAAPSAVPAVEAAGSVALWPQPGGRLGGGRAVKHGHPSRQVHEAQGRAREAQGAPASQPLVPERTQFSFAFTFEKGGASDGYLGLHFTYSSLHMEFEHELVDENAI